MILVPYDTTRSWIAPNKRLSVSTAKSRENVHSQLYLTPIWDSGLIDFSALRMKSRPGYVIELMDGRRRKRRKVNITPKVDEMQFSIFCGKEERQIPLKKPFQIHEV